MQSSRFYFFFPVRPSFFNFLIYEKFFKILESGGRNKNKNKIHKIVQSIKKIKLKPTLLDFFLFLEVAFSVLNWLLKTAPDNIYWLVFNKSIFVSNDIL